MGPLRQKQIINRRKKILKRQFIHPDKGKKWYSYGMTSISDYVPIKSHKITVSAKWGRDNKLHVKCCLFFTFGSYKKPEVNRLHLQKHAADLPQVCVWGDYSFICRGQKHHSHWFKDTQKHADCAKKNVAEVAKYNGPKCKITKENGDESRKCVQTFSGCCRPQLHVHLACRYNLLQMTIRWLFKYWLFQTSYCNYLIRLQWLKV